MKKLAFLSLLSCLLFFAFHNSKNNPATNFLNSLNDEQLKKAQYEFDHELRENWHFLPGAMWPREGIQLFELNEEQKRLAFELLESSLSKSGYSKTKKIIELENVLAQMDNNEVFRDTEKYAVSVYGNPAEDDLWGWSFEGHHISLHFTVVEGDISMSPRFMGASPAIIQSGERKGEQTLAKEENMGLKLINSMTEEQREKAIFSKKAYAEIVTANATEVAPFKPVGIRMGDLNSEQKNSLTSLIFEYLSTMPVDLATERLKKIEQEESDEIHFGWAGATVLGKGHYYRIQGKSFLVEFDNTQSDANHIHTVWRDFDGDFGRDLIREHYDHHH